MLRTLVLAIMLCPSLIVPCPILAQDSASVVEIPDHEKPFWDNAKAFLNAYASRDPNAIGQLFTEDAEFWDEFGELTEGRESIVALFTDVFEISPNAEFVEIKIDRVRYITDTVAMESGVTIARDVPGGPTAESRYVALHVKGEDGVWRINTLKDYPREEPEGGMQLDELEWLVGEWVNEEGEAMIHTSCEWAESGKYLLRSYEVETTEGRERSGQQRVGWDSVRKTIRSWTFDADGGYAEGTWTNTGGIWVVTSHGYTPDGEETHFVSRFHRVSQERLVWEFTSVVIGGEIREVPAPVILVKKPPQPAAVSSK